jgi:hypothetical protein
MKQSMTEDADAEGEINQIVFAELVTHVGREALLVQMKHSSRCNDRSSVGAVELFLVNLNDDGTSERLVSGV